jgi:hypothetical protein
MVPGEPFRALIRPAVYLWQGSQPDWWIGPTAPARRLGGRGYFRLFVGAIGFVVRIRGQGFVVRIRGHQTDGTGTDGTGTLLEAVSRPPLF